MRASTGKRSRSEAADEPNLSPGEIRERAARGVVLVALRGLAIRIGGLAGYLVLARLLDPTDFGVAAFGLSFVFVAHFLIDVGVGPALIRRAAAPTRSDYAAVVGFQLAATSVIAAGAAIWAVASGARVAGVTAVFLASLPFLSFRLPAAISLERALDYRPFILSDLAEVLAYNGWAVGTVLAGWGVYGLASAAVVKTLAGTIVLSSMAPVKWVRPTADGTRVRSLLPFGLAFQASSAVSLGRDQAINFGTATIAGYHVLGLWAIANRLIGVPLLMFESLWRVSFPAMSKLLATGERPDEVLRRGVRMAAVAAGFLLAPLAVAAPPALSSALGDDWQKAGSVLPLVFLGMTAALPISVVAIGYLYACGEAGAVLRVNVAVTAAMIAVAFVGLPLVGYISLGCAQLAAALVDGYMLSRAVRRASGVEIGRGVVPATAAWLIAFGAGESLLLFSWPRLAAAVFGAVLAVSVYATAIVMFDRDSTVRTWRLIRTLPNAARRSRTSVAQDVTRPPFTGTTLPDEDSI